MTAAWLPDPVAAEPPVAVQWQLAAALEQALLAAAAAPSLRRALEARLAAARRVADPLAWAALVGEALVHLLAAEQAAGAAAQAEAAALRARVVALEQALADQQRRHEAALAGREAELADLRHIVARQQLQLHTLLDQGT